MKIVITGALGHIGSHLIRRIPALFPGAEIVMVDNFLTQRYASLFNLPEKVKYNFIEADILTADLEAIFSGAEVVIHLAAITNAAASFENKEQVELVNFSGTERVAKACLSANSALVFPSTTSVYGSQDELVDEDCPLKDLKPQSPYADSKLRAELLLNKMGDSHGLRFLICRLGTIFGASIGMRFHTAINKFCWQAVFKEPISVWRTALHQYRPYLDLDDASRAISFVVKNRFYERSVYNIVTVNKTVDDIIRIISRYEPGVKVEFVDTRIMNQLSYKVSSGRFTDKGFKFDGDIESGIKETIGLIKCSAAFKK
ncbi:MAG: SDR family oxidoreductase [Candidatus Omnitrophota bacterium]